MNINIIRFQNCFLHFTLHFNYFISIQLQYFNTFKIILVNKSVTILKFTVGKIFECFCY